MKYQRRRQRGAAIERNSLCSNNLKQSRRTTTSVGFTLIEVLVAIGIIGLLLAILIPAVQAARESSRNAQCKNNLKQIALAILNSESRFGHLPTGGWHPALLGDPLRGTGVRQMGGWWWCILPDIEMQAAHEYRGVPHYNDGLFANPLAACPTRGLGPTFDGAPGGVNRAVYLWSSSKNVLLEYRAEYGNKVPRSDYAANGGDVNPPGNCHMGGLPAPDGDKWGRFPEHPAAAFFPETHPAWDWLWDPWHRPGAGLQGHPELQFNGVIFEHSAVSLAAIRDGVSNTYLVGEKSVQPDPPPPASNFTNGDTRYWIYSGPHLHTIRFSRHITQDPYSPQLRPPIYNDGKTGDDYLFGSSHTGGVNMAMCDGSVHAISFDIDPELHRRLSNRHDGQPIPADAL